jgi:hypothetical protein
VPGSVVDGVGVRTGFSASSLVEKNDSVLFGIEEYCVGRVAASTGSAVEVDYCVVLGIEEKPEMEKGQFCSYRAFRLSFRIDDSTTREYHQHEANRHPKHLRAGSL